MRAGGGSGEDWGDGVKCYSLLGKTEGMIRWFYWGDSLQVCLLLLACYLFSCLVSSRCLYGV